MITVLLLDLDGVLRLWDPSLTGSVEASYGLPPGALSAAVSASSHRDGALTGAMDDRSWRESIAEDIAREHGEGCRPAVEDWMTPAGTVDTDVLEVVRRARTTMRVMLLTNATSRLPDDLETLGLTDEVDGAVSSCDLGLAKPDPDVFSLVALRHRLMFSEIAYVDPSTTNIAVAEILGIRSHHYADAEGLGEFVDGLMEPAERI
ncbi:HAD family hydrolase [Knoellia sp. LjRoot47]|uniref:HAD family hydrolase n=1 Tax=Knoellia sp. LjRoot47 TaxID=3342330 RepID=UPI003ED03F6E